MKYHISIHISPYEIDNYQTFIHQLRRNLNYVKDDIIFTPMLNVADYFYNWDKSTLSKKFFTDKFRKINQIIEQLENVTVYEYVNKDDKILGAFSYKTMFLKQYKNEVDAFIWFDSDMLFPDNTISSLIMAHKHNPNHCIITPQIHRLWDDTWDVLVNEDYIDVEATHENYFGFDGYELFNIKDRELSITENPYRFKFGAGWCNLLSSDLFKDYIDFTYDLGHYGPDDTFIMCILDHYKFVEGKDINQYVIKNLIITENYKHSISPYNDLIIKNQGVKTKEEFTKEVQIAVNNRLQKLKK